MFRSTIRSLALAAALAVSVAGCSTLDGIVGVATTTISNPVNAVDIYRVKNAYAAALTGASAYRNYCYSKPYAAILADSVMKPVCQNRRTVIRAMQLAAAKASSAISSAQSFVANNPTLDASSFIAAAWAAVTNFQNATPPTQ